MASMAACAGVLHCGTDVLVGINASASTRPIVTAPADGDAGVGPALTSLRAVVRTAADTHVTAGITGCAAAGEAACEGWVGTIAGALAEETRITGPGADQVLSLALLGEDRVLAGARAPSGVSNAWVARRTASALVWERSLASDTNRPSDARGVALTPSGGLVVIGNESIDAFETGWIALVAADGTVTKRVRINNSQSTTESAFDVVAVLPGGLIYVGGRRRQTIDGVATTVPIVVEYAADLTLYNSASGIGITEVGTGGVRTILTDRQREIAVCAQFGDGVAVSRMWDYLSDVYLTRVLTDPAGRVELGGCAATDDGGLVLAGTIDVGGPRPWATKLDRVTLEPRWSRSYRDQTGRIEAVAAARGGSAVAVGTSDGRAYHLALDP